MTAAGQAAPRVLDVGLTGGIACGRTTVGGIFSRLGALVLDMDKVAHELMAPGGAAVEAVAGAMGREFLDAAGGIDRRALGALVFSDRAARARLESILHPMILDTCQSRVARFGAQRGRGIAISDAALLVETGGHHRYQRLVVVFCEPELQLRRLMARDGFSEAEARLRIAAQLPLEEKKKVADYLIDTSGTLATTEVRAREVYGHLREDLDLLPDLPPRRSAS